MSTKSKAELAALAGGSVYTVNQLLSGLSAHKHGDDDIATEHYLKAATGAALAFGAYELLQMEKEEEEEEEEEILDGRKRVKRHKEIEYGHEHEGGHTRRMLEEAAGAYALGKELAGDTRHHRRHRVAEALGIIGLLKEAKRHAH
ncbi:hypothetical protein TWF281_011397 [Arthrobotrys megalospora]